MAELRHGRVLRRVLALFVLAAVLPIGLAATGSFYQVKAALTNETYTRLYNASKFHGITVLERLLATRTQLERLSTALSQGSAYLEPLLEDLAVHTNAIVTVDSAGNTIVVAGKPAAAAFPLDPGESGQGTDKASIISRQGSGEVFMAVSYGDLPQNKGRLVALLNPSYLFGTEEDHLLTANFCVFEQRIMLYCTARLRQYLGNLPSFGGLGDSAEQLYWKSPDGRFFMSRRDLFLPSQFNAQAWTVLSAEDETSAYAPIRTFRWMFPAVVTLAVLCVLLLVVFQTRRQLTPLSVLRNGALRLGSGDFDSRISLQTGDEFEDLAVTFNDMADRLRTQFHFLIAMSEIDSMLLSSPGVVTVTEALVKRLPGLLSVDVAAAFVIDKDNPAEGRLFVAGPGDNGQVKIERTALDDSLLERSAQSDYFTLEAQTDESGLVSRVSPPGGRAHLFPLHFEERLLGCLCLGTEAAADLSAGHMEQALSVASRLTVALSAVERQRRLYEQAHYDSMTGLPNRALFLDRLALCLVQAERSGKRVAILYADLDHFKMVNDTLGHSQGDEVLKQAAVRFRQAVRESDTVARLSGDEFAFAMPELAEPRDAIKVAQGIISKLRDPFELMGQQFVLAASVGIAIYPEDGHSAEELLKNADVAMYRAKADRRSHYRFFEESMNAEVIERSNLGQQLRGALGSQQLTLAYQPMVDTGTNRVHSAEALMRWHHPEMGVIHPDKFIAVAEEIGLIEQLGEFALNSACAQMARWRAAGLPIRQVAVNVSSRQVLHTDIVDAVRGALDSTGLPAACLELELTESLLIEDYATTERVLSQLRELGVGLALDDFGTGYSSLNYLHKLPFDTLKIDKSFVDDLGNKAEVDSIVTSIVALAKNLDKKIVAEGVEREMQRQFLTGQGCQLLQGYLYSRPVSPQQLTVILEQDQPLPLPGA